ncbi:MAG: S-layer homology domain-containing protein [Clostridia bacterium]|nr:S-layer homology domain-containing protein [Clostridia bacterium]
MKKRIGALVLACSLLTAMPAMAAPSVWASVEVSNAEKAGIVPARITADYQTAITREEFCEMVMLFWTKAAGKDMPQTPVSFSDTENAAVAAAAGLSIVKGIGDGLFAPQNPITRQEICVMLQRALLSACPEIALPDTYVNTFPDGDAVADWAMYAVQSMNTFAVMLGDENGNINPLGNTTREQAILLTYRLLQTQQVSMASMIESLLGSGCNTHDNMLDGGFIASGEAGSVCYADTGGITKLSDTERIKLTTAGAKNIFVLSDTVYYIGTDDSIYIIEGGAERKLIDTKADGLAAYYGYVFYRNMHDGKIYSYQLKTAENKVYIDKNVELPVFAGEGTFYSDGQAVYKVEKEGSTLIYTGVNRNLCLKDKTFYFIGENDGLYTMNLDGSNVKLLYNGPVKSYNFARKAIVLHGGEDNAIYRLAYNGKYCIRIGTSTYVRMNTYDDYVYGMDSEGVIHRFKIDATDKAKVN